MPDSTHPVPDDVLLLCVDMQPRFVAAVEHGERIRRRCEFALAAARGLGLPIAFSEQVPAKLGGTAPELLAAAPGAPVWGKETFSALADPVIRRALDDRAVRHLLICGIETPICVYQTALDAIASGMQATVLADAVGARRSDDAAACLQALTRAGAHVLPAETVFYALLRDVSHPFFREYTRLVRHHHDAVSA
ncbi:MAG: isochorismatase family protein [Opitutaceae bacterium]|nr:isochorismatase family protein [Opitutaceae bacterium]